MAASNNNRYSQEFVFSEEDDYSLDESEIETNLIDETNKLLSATGIVAKKIMSVAELARVSSSIFVAIFESVYHTRIEEVLRNPVTRSDYEYNAQLVIERLSEQINSDLSHITGSLIVNGDMTALKNLVNIFTRILSFTSHGIHSTSTIESEDSLEEHGEFGGGMVERKRQSFNTSQDSISTKDSLPPPRKVSKQHRESPRKMATSPQRPATTPTKSISRSPHRKYDDVVHRSLEKAEGYLKKEIDLHQAALRRKSAKLWQQTKLRGENQRRSEISRIALQHRKLAQSKRSEKSFQLKCDSEEDVLLRKVYQALLRETLRFRNEEKLQEKAYQRAKEEELEQQLEQLQRLFRERMETIREEDQRTSNTASESIKQGKAAYLGLEERYSELIEREEAWREQCRQREFCTKRKGYKNLLTMLKAEKWSDSLRSYD